MAMDQNRVHGQFNDEIFFTSSIIQSHNLSNAAHYDVDDKTRSISTWTELNPGQAKGWYFILPNTTRDGSKGIAIRLNHGVTIGWDGRKIYHCSMIDKIGMDNSLYGTFFGVKK